jgi:hypothetical protein
MVDQKPTRTPESGMYGNLRDLLDLQKNGIYFDRDPGDSLQTGLGNWENVWLRRVAYSGSLQATFE